MGGLEELEAEVEQQRETQQPVVGEDDIRDVISQWTGVPLSRIADPLVGHGFGRSIVAVWTRPV